jgi:PPOX class probable F420-dependent enzyme
MTVFHDPLRAGRPSAAARHAATEILAGPHLAVLSTVNLDGAPQSSVIFVKPDGDDILFSTINGRRKTTNMRRDPRVTLLLHALPNTEAASTYATISGTVTITDDPDSSFHQVMYDLHMDGAIPPAEPGAERLIVRLSPDRTYAPPAYIAE